MSFPCSPIYFILYIEKCYSEVRSTGFTSLRHKKVHQLCPREWWSHGEENHPQTSEMHNVWIPFPDIWVPSLHEREIPSYSANPRTLWACQLLQPSLPAAASSPRQSVISYSSDRHPRIWKARASARGSVWPQSKSEEQRFYYRCSGLTMDTHNSTT